MPSDMIRVGRIWAVARNTFRETVRNRVFLGVVIFGVVCILFSMVLSQLTVVGQGRRVVLDFGFFAISLFGALTAIMLGAVAVYKEVEQKTVYTIVSKPVRRYEFILGKYAGMWAILMAEVAVLAAVWCAVLWSQGGHPGMVEFKGMLLVAMETGLVAAVAMMFSARSSPVFTGLFSLGVFVVGRSVYLIAQMLNASKGLFVSNGIAHGFGEAIVTVFPDLSVFNISQQVLLGVPVTWGYVLQAFVYAVSYGVIFLAIAMIAFERRDFI